MFFCYFQRFDYTKHFPSSIYPHDHKVFVRRVIVGGWVEAVGILGGEVVGDINVVPDAVYEDAVPGVLGGTVGSGIAVDDIAWDALASADGGEEAGDIVADTRFCLQGFGDVRILIEAVVVMIVGKILGHPGICRKYLLFIGRPGGNLVEDIFVLGAPQDPGTVCQWITDC